MRNSSPSIWRHFPVSRDKDVGKRKKIKVSGDERLHAHEMPANGDEISHNSDLSVLTIPPIDVVILITIESGCPPSCSKFGVATSWVFCIFKGSVRVSRAVAFRSDCAECESCTATTGMRNSYLRCCSRMIK